MKLRAALAGVLLLAAALGCAGVVQGDVTVDGQPFALANCHSGAPDGFRGVDVVDDAGAKLRMEQNNDGTAHVWYFPAGSMTGEDLGSCGSISVQDQNSEINGVTNVMGTAELSCSGARTVAGEASFENCH